MAKPATQLSVAKNSDAAAIVAATIHDLLDERDAPASARDASAFRMVRKHLRELVDLHDDLDAKDIFIVSGGSKSTPAHTFNGQEG